MNGIHDLGGLHGLGPINPDPQEPLFKHDWEKRIFGMFFTNFAVGHFNVDEFRYGIEKMAPAEYLTATYYAHWAHTIEDQLVQKGVLTLDEIDARVAQLAGKVS